MLCWRYVYLTTGDSSVERRFCCFESRVPFCCVSASGVAFPVDEYNQTGKRVFVYDINCIADCQVIL